MTERDREVQAYLALPLMEKFRSPVDQPVDLAVVEMDGGRLQILDRRDAKARSSEDEAQTQGTGLADEQDEEEEPRHGHWREDKITCDDDDQ